MKTVLSKSAVQVLQHPLGFVLATLRGFHKNQGVLLAGAVAYYALLSVVPMLILSMIALSQFFEPGELLTAAGRYLEWLIPSQSRSLLKDVSDFLAHSKGIGIVLILTMLFFSSLAFSVLEKAMTVIFSHRHATRQRHALVSALIPYCFLLSLGIVLIGVTIISIAMQALAQESVSLFGTEWSLHGVSGLMLYLVGLTVETLVFTAIYIVMPVGRTRLSHALIGGLTAMAVWELIRHTLVWYFTTLSRVSVVYGSLTTAVVALFSMEIAAMLLLYGAQVIAEYEQLEMK